MEQTLFPVPFVEISLWGAHNCRGTREGGVSGGCPEVLWFQGIQVRHHGETARIEILEADIPRFLDPALRIPVTRNLRALGYRYVTLDLDGFRSGRLNEAVSESQSSQH